ncbi:methyltransferase domain-containing protein [Candidatus Woesearchaeota archaeon]|nr:methyltransferase domain-containing protein [Candidatus Woesearchaeota archaeon]
MKQMFVLSQENLKLAKAEIAALTNKPSKLYDYILVSDSSKQLNNRLAYARLFYKFLFICEEDELERKIKEFDWNKYYQNSFCVRKFGKSSFNELHIADLVWERLKNPNADLKNPKTRFDFYFTKKWVLCGLLVSKARTDFDKRMPKLRPGIHPSTMKPRLAACLVNLTGINSGVIYDPMCGTGGILIEAAAMNLNTIGSDIDELMLKQAEKNLKHYNLKAKIFKQDALKIKKAYNYIVTDLPYGKNTRSLDQKKFYLAFLKNLKKILKTRAVIVFPDFIKHKSLIKRAGLKLKAEYSYYLHRTMSRVICVIEA